jgi:TRAP-type C4-dicarboxylate transport system permease small subunit
MKLLRWLDKYLEETLLVLFLVIIACVSLFQVAARNLPWLSALTWAEEFCRFCWIGSVFLSLPYTIQRGSMLRVNALMQLLPPRAGKGLELAVDLAVMAAMGLLAVCSVGVVGDIFASGETSPAMKWPMWCV